MLAQLQGGGNFRRRFPRLGGQVCMRIYTDDPCRFIGHSGSRQAGGFSLQQRYQPFACALWVRFGLSDK
jgi:hypothetical protein